jgi:hypothetical protein
MDQPADGHAGRNGPVTPGRLSTAPRDGLH